eukprot:SAG22_NODE_4476_length_1257_cov_1.255613_2_plen_63_part_00
MAALMALAVGHLAAAERMNVLLVLVDGEPLGSNFCTVHDPACARSPGSPYYADPDAPRHLRF